jgi:NAD(P)-dependent dehydrogenase (short-subunit alcohol dehydrogenase family)
VVDLPDSSAIEPLLAELDESAGAGMFEPADVTSFEQIGGVVDRVVRERGRIDAIMNNAGINGPIAVIEDYPEDAFDRVIGVNLKAVWLGMKAVIPQMKRQGSGVILNTASTAGVTAYVGTSAYTAAKHGVVGLTKLAAQELAPIGVRVNCLCPASVHTPMMHDTEANAVPGDPLAARRTFEAQIPMGRYGEPEEVAALAAFLLSDEASYITGAPFLIDGGMMAGGMGTATRAEGADRSGRDHPR